MSTQTTTELCLAELERTAVNLPNTSDDPDCLASPFSEYDIAAECITFVAKCRALDVSNGFFMGVAKHLSEDNLTSQPMAETNYANPNPWEDQQIARIDAKKAKRVARKERKKMILAINAEPMSPHLRNALTAERDGLLVQARHEKSTALKVRWLSAAKHITERLAADLGKKYSGFDKLAAETLATSKDTIRRATYLGGRLLPNLLQAVANTSLDFNDTLLKLSKLSPEDQHRFAQLVMSKKSALVLGQSVWLRRRERTINPVIHEALYKCGKSDPATISQITRHSLDEQVQIVGRLQDEAAAEQALLNSSLNGMGDLT